MLIFPFFVIFSDKYIEVELNPAVVEGVGLEHGEEVEPLGVESGVLEVLSEEDTVEAVEIFGYLSHNDNYKCDFGSFLLLNMHMRPRNLINENLLLKMAKVTPFHIKHKPKTSKVCLGEK